jgi:histidine triad (HIT) family protein
MTDEEPLIDCAFCGIAQTTLPPNGLFEDESFFVILDRNSLGFGHCMVIPRRHVAKIYELSDSETSGLFVLARKIATQLENVLGVKSVAYVAFGSGLHHAHLHLVPHNDPRVLEYPHEYLKKLSDEELAADAKRLRAMLTSALTVE